VGSRTGSVVRRTFRNTHERSLLLLFVLRLVRQHLLEQALLAQLKRPFLLHSIPHRP
jgi:hypothetical protein